MGSLSSLNPELVSPSLAVLRQTWPDVGLAQLFQDITACLY